MRKYVCLLMFGSLMLLNLRVVEAGSGIAVRANVPFEFYVGNSKMPAGEYTIRESRFGSTFLQVRKDDGGNSAYVSSNAANPKSSESSAELIFHRYNDDYFLSEVWSTGNEMGNRIGASKKELELVKGASQASKTGSGNLRFVTVTVAALR
jgi:hypothetical protein